MKVALENGKNRMPKLGGNSEMEIRAIRSPRYSEGAPVTLFCHSLKTPDNRARLAMSCLEKWGMVCAEPDGEDTAGRQKAKRMTPAQIAVLACDCSDEIYKQFETRGWLIETPSYDALIDAVKDMENGND